MEKHNLKILKTFYVTHDVKCFRLEKPGGYSFEPGQATEMAINKPGWEDKTRPFTFTSLPEDDYLEFIIKIYPAHKGVTNELLRVRENDELILNEVFGAITYQGKGVFIAGGAGITPFIAILRNLRKKGELAGNALIFGNKKKKDIILEDELREMLGDDFANILSDEEAEGYAHGIPNKDFIRDHVEDLDQKFYICGPPRMMKLVLKDLAGLGVPGQAIVKEEL